MAERSAVLDEATREVEAPMEELRHAIDRRAADEGRCRWRCPDCGASCGCSGFARLLRHDRCGLGR